MPRKSDYSCSVCGMPCYDIDGAVTRICTHESATITAERTSTLHGDGGARETSLAERFIAAALRILGVCNQ